MKEYHSCLIYQLNWSTIKNIISKKSNLPLPQSIQISSSLEDFCIVLKNAIQIKKKYVTDIQQIEFNIAALSVKGFYPLFTT